MKNLATKDDVHRRFTNLESRVSTLTMRVDGMGQELKTFDAIGGLDAVGPMVQDIRAAGAKMKLLEEKFDALAVGGGGGGGSSNAVGKQRQEESFKRLVVQGFPNGSDLQACMKSMR